MSDDLEWDEIPGVRVAVTATAVIHGRKVPTAVTISSEDGVDGDLLRKIPLGRIETLLNADSSLRQRYSELVHSRDKLKEENLRMQQALAGIDSDLLCKLEIPAGGKYGDEFYQRVALAWQWLAGRGEPPAKRLAAVNGVPETTTNRWAKEARRRGFLPPARRKGKS